MRFNRGTLVLLAVSVVVILAVLLLNNQPASAPAPTPEATAEGAGPVFPALAEAQDSITRFEALNNDTAEKTVLTKDDGGIWTVDEATNASELATDQTKAASVVQSLAGFVATSFALGDQKVEDFGLDTPAYTFTLTDKDSAAYTLKLGNKNLNSNYYAFVNDDAATVYLLPGASVDTLIQQVIAVPPYVASATPTNTPTITPNPYSEVEQTATTAVEMTQFFQMLTANAEASVEATAEATAAPGATATPTPSS